MAWFLESVKETLLGCAHIYVIMFSMLIRPATINDAPILAALHVAGWKSAYGGIIDQSYLDGLSVGKREQDWRGWLNAGESRVFIAEKEGLPIGFAAWGRTRTPPPGSSPIRPSHSAEIYALYVHPDHWRQKAGLNLWMHILTDMKDGKHSSFCLWVLDANQRAKAFYLAMGGQKLGGKTVEIGPSKVKEICYGWRDISKSSNICKQ